MRCRSVAGIWPETPPPHRVTAAAVLSEPPSLYTGAGDGSIVWWSFFAGDNSFTEIKPVAVLCGHGASIAALDICYPPLASEYNNMDQSSNIVTKGTGGDCGALISACTDGVLCVWSRRSGHCRRRRKLPPWVGSPSILQRLATNPRYVCVASCVGETSRTAYQTDTNDIDASPEVLGDPELIRKQAKSVIVIVDSYTLSITETIFHGKSLIGPLKFMAFPEPAQHVRKIVLADSVGHLQLISRLQDSDLDAEPWYHIGTDILRELHHPLSRIWYF